MKNEREFDTWKLPNGKYQCPHCQKEYSSKGIGSHIWRKHSKVGKEFIPNSTGESWCKGLTIETDERLKKQGEKISKALKGKKRKPLGEEHKKNISNGMKKAHDEKRAWNIGKSRWNNEPSYPETFFMKVIENEFEDKNYENEYNVSIYSIDFAWIEKKKAIEIDGDQHYRFEDYIERDKRKDKCLEENGWKLLRIKWKDMYKDTKHWIKVAKDFIEN